MDRLLQDLSDADSLASEEGFHDIFDDDSDNDPLYQPGNEQSSDSDSDSNMPSTSGNQVRPPPPSQSNLNRSVLNSSSSESDDNDVNIDNDIWISMNSENPHVFTHQFSYNEIPGPRHCPPIDSKPIDYFNLFFTEALLNIFVVETNRYANQTITELVGLNEVGPHSRRQNWLPVTFNEIRAFIAVILNMGLIRKPTIPSYWSTTANNSLVPQNVY